MASRRVLTIAMLHTWLRCPTMYHIAYELGYRPAEASPAVAWGQAWRRVVRECWGTGARTDSPSGLGEHADAGMFALRDGYLNRHGQPCSNSLEERWTDRPWVRPLINPDSRGLSRRWVLAGRYDRVVNGGWWVMMMGHAVTTWKLDGQSFYWRRPIIGWEAAASVGAAMVDFPDAKEIIYYHDAVSSPALKPLLAMPKGSHRQKRDHDETPYEYGLRVREAITCHPGRYCNRQAISVPMSCVRDFMRDAWALASLVTEERSSRRHSRVRNLWSCVERGESCPYYSNCHLGIPLESPRWKNIYQTQNEDKGGIS